MGISRVIGLATCRWKKSARRRLRWRAEMSVVTPLSLSRRSVSSTLSVTLPTVTPSAVGRPHTGRRRNEAAERAILRAAAELLVGGQGAQITVDAIAERAGVGKQTIYRWWPSKSALLLDAMIHRAEAVAPAPDSGDLQTDLRGFLRSTFAAMPGNRSLLLGVLREALGDLETMDQLAAFTAARRDALAQILRRAEISEPERLDTIVDQAFGLLWYRMIFAHQPLDDRVADQLAAALAAQTGWEG